MTTALVNWEQLKHDVATAHSIDDLKEIRDKTEALRLYSKRQKDSVDMQNKFAEITLRCERRAGEMLREMPKNEGGRPTENLSISTTGFPPKLSDIGITRDQSSQWQAIANIPQETFEQHIEEVKASRQELTTTGFVQLAKRQVKEQEREQLRERGVVLPTGKFSCIVIDPPWQMQKIERDVRPNQVEFDYPTMSEDELKVFPLPDFSADDCHLYLWTTQKYLPMALRLAEHWGFKYQCLMTWVKNVGFTPFSWMYSTEHVLFCTKGSLQLLRLGMRLDFNARVREHSRKPDEFYDIVRQASPEPRLDVFSREKREGFEQYGNEPEKFVQAG